MTLPKIPAPVRMRATALFAIVLLALAPFPSRALASEAPATPSDWLPAGIEQLGRSATYHTDFTFDRTMLQMASGLVDGGDPDTRKAIAKLNGVTIHLYRYAAPGMYDIHQLDAIRDQYRSAGWKHLVSKNSHPMNPAPMPITPSPSGPPMGQAAPAPYALPPGIDLQGRTDLYIKMQGVDVVGMVVLQAGSRNLNVVALIGDLSPVDLLHLRGHFGIPKFAGDSFAPADN
jgi:hypothetical protein